MGTNVEQRTRASHVVGRLLAVTATLASFSVPALASAHMGSTKSIELRHTSTGATVQVEVDAVDAALAIGLPMRATPAQLDRHAPLVRGWLTAGITLDSGAGPCTSATGELAHAESDGRAIVRASMSVDCPASAGELRLRDDTVFADDPDHETFVAVVGDGGSEGHVLRGDSRTLRIAATPSSLRTAVAFLREGAFHLVTGYDHLLFLLALVLASGLAARTLGLRRGFTDVAWVVTAFTAGHSVSLAAAALGWIVLPSSLVEVAIAGSIVVAAGIELVRRGPPDRRLRPWLAGAFGLVHGFGFSSVLAEVGLPTAQRVLALAAFNVGIELAQLAFVAAVMVPLVWAARHPGYRLVVVRGGSLAIAACGCVWLVERGLGS